MRSLFLVLCLVVLACATIESNTASTETASSHFPKSLERFVRRKAEATDGGDAGGECQEEEQDNHEPTKDFGVMVCLISLIIVFIGGHIIEGVFKLTVLPEAGFAVLVGALLSLFFYLSQGKDKTLSDIISFDKEFFFFWLLPPIIFEAGYNMKRKEFFANIVPTCLFAFIGTAISTFVIGVVVYYSGQAGICYELNLLESLIFGALVSATDPVSVLAVFQSLGVDINLFSMVFGEAVLNDAVALVLYRTLVKFRCDEFTSGSVGVALGTFLYIFVLSSLIGAAMGLACAWLLRAMGLDHHEGNHFTEASITAMFAWASYYMAEGFHLSGIVAIMFAGILMAEYAYDNLSQPAKDLSRQMYKVIAKIAETFVFVYLGMALFAFQTEPDESGHFKLVFLSKTNFSLAGVTIVGCLLGRALNILPCVGLTNLFRSGPPNSMPKISGAFTLIMWWSGLRGGVAFAISVANYHDSGFSEQSVAVLQATLFVAVFTIFVFGGSITRLALYFNVLESKEAHAQHFDSSGLAARPPHRIVQKVDGLIRASVSRKVIYQQHHDELEMQNQSKTPK